MITDFFIALVNAIVRPLIDLLPVTSLTIPGASTIAGFISSLDYLVPIVAILQVGAAILAAGVAFFAIRIAIFFWQQVKW